MIDINDTPTPVIPRSMRPRIEPTMELLEKINLSQLKCVKEHVDAAIERGYGDDGYDYLKGALALSRDLIVAEYDGDLKMLDDLINGDENTSDLQFIACDGICEELFALDCNALACLYDDDPANFPRVNE